MTIEVSYRKESVNTYRLTFDRRILGDSKGYPSAMAAREAALTIVDADHARARAEGREAEYVFRPSV